MGKGEDEEGNVTGKPLKKRHCHGVSVWLLGEGEEIGGSKEGKSSTLVTF